MHGEEAAAKARDAAKDVFAGGGRSENMPTTSYSASEMKEGKDLITLLVDTGIAKTRSDGRRLIEQNGISVNSKKVNDFKAVFTSDDFDSDGELIIQKGKKIFHRIITE